MLVNEQLAASQADSSILHPSSRSLFRFWEASRAEKAAPTRENLDLRTIRNLIPYLLIAEFHERTGTYRLRLAGTGVCELYRREMTGSDFLMGWDSFEASVMSRFLGAVVRNHQPCLLRFRLTTDLGEVIGAEMVGLPLLAGDGRSIHVFGGIFPFREIQSLAYASIVRAELSGARSIWTEHLPGDQLLSQIQAAGGSLPFRPFQVIAGGRGHS